MRSVLLQFVMNLPFSTQRYMVVFNFKHSIFNTILFKFRQPKLSSNSNLRYNYYALNSINCNLDQKVTNISTDIPVLLNVLFGDNSVRCIQNSFNTLSFDF